MSTLFELLKEKAYFCLRLAIVLLFIHNWDFDKVDHFPGGQLRLQKKAILKKWSAV